MTVRHSPRFKEGSWAGKAHYTCSLCPFDTFDKGAVLRHVRERHPLESEGAEPEDPFIGLRFARGAGELALELGLTRKQFEGRTPSGRTGFTVADVKRLSAATTEEA